MTTSTQNLRFLSRRFLVEMCRNVSTAPSSHLDRQCKARERLQLSGCWGVKVRSTVIETHRLVMRSTVHDGAGSPWHSDASLPPCRTRCAPGSLELGGWGVRGSRQWMPGGGLSVEEAKRPLDGARVAQSSKSGTPGSDHVGKLGKARRMPNTSALEMCRRPASGIDLTLARRIGRIWTRPVGRGNIAPSRSKEQTYRSFASEDLCVCRRHGRAATHTFRGESPQVVTDLPRGVGRASVGAR